MPPKGRKKAAPKSSAPTKSRKNISAETVPDSDDDFEHLAIEAADRYILSYC